MTTTTLIPAVLDYLYGACKASTLLGAAQPTPVVVFDGPNITSDTATELLHLWIGYDPLNPGGQTATSDQDWPNLDHARTLDENSEIVCCAEAWAGGDTVKAVRDSCDAIVAAVALLLRGTGQPGDPGDTTMGGLLFWSRVSAGSWYQRPTQNGIAVNHVFKIVYYGRLTTG